MSDLHYDVTPVELALKHILRDAAPEVGPARDLPCAAEPTLFDGRTNNDVDAATLACETRCRSYDRCRASLLAERHTPLPTGIVAGVDLRPGSPARQRLSKWHNNRQES